MNVFHKKILFEWDEGKNQQNIQKHGLSFETAAKVFDDIMRIEIFDEIHSTDEDRYITIGLVNKVILVVYTMRKNNIRIISARIANQLEKELYYDS